MINTPPTLFRHARPRAAGVCLVALLALSSGRAVAASFAERWFVFSIAESPVGHAVERRSVEGASQLTASHLEATLNRLGSSVAMRFDTTTRESAAGELEWLRSDVKLSQQVVRLEAFIEPDRVRLVASSGDDAPAAERVVERGREPLLGPQGVRRLSGERLRREGDRVEYATFSAELQRVVAMHRTVTATGVAAPCDPSGPATTAIDEVLAGMPGTRQLWLDADGELVQDTMEGPFGPMTTCRASREAAVAAAGGSLSEEIYARTLVRSNLRLADPAAVDRLVLRLEAIDPARPLPDLRHHNQAVRTEDDALLVEIRRPTAPPAAAGGEGPAGSGGDGAWTAVGSELLAPNAFIESSDPAIVALAREIVGEERDPYRAALRLSEWVAENLTLDLGVVMAPSRELLRDRRATCMGYATLLATLARAVAIPSRVAMGLVYYGGIWGGHAWTEVWVGDRWLPLDAAVYAPEVASAVRLAAGASSLQDGGGELTGRLAQLFGNVEVSIVELESDGTTVEVPAEQAAYELAGTTYRNPGLGLAIDAAGWSIEDADAVWPSTLVVAFRRGSERVELHQLPAAPPARATTMLREALAEQRAVLARPVGGTVWIYRAAGPRPWESLRDLVARIEEPQAPLAGRRARR